MRAAGGVTRNVAWSLFGQGAPLLAAVVCMPLLADRLGLPRLGLLTLVWGLIGYFGLFDLGIGRALTKTVAERLAADRADPSLGRVVRTGLALSAGLGIVVGAAALLVFPTWLVPLLSLPDDLRPEVVSAGRAIGWALPCVILSATLRGSLEGLQRFASVNVSRVAVGTGMFVVPAVIAHAGGDLADIVIALTCVRAVEAVALLVVVARAVPGLSRRHAWSRADAGLLVRLSSWMAVSNIVGPLMMYFDRFVIAGTVSAAAAAQYAAPYEVVTRILVLPAALATVLFPGFAARLAADLAGARALYASGLRAAVLMVLLPVVGFVTLAPDLLQLWLGPGFGAESVLVLRILAIGVLLNAVGQIPFALLQSAGRPDRTAALHLAELPGYLLLLVVLVDRHGIAGAAAAWTVRAAIDAVALCWTAHRLLPRVATMPARGAWILALAAVGIGAGWLLSSTAARVVFVAAFSGISAALVWRAILTDHERTRVLAALGRVPTRSS
jgi:O-antigen/teichoic acid export membrane protein